MMRYAQGFTALCLFFTWTTVLPAQDWRRDYATHFEQSDGWDTAEYATAIQFYRRLANDSARVTMTEMGPTDSGRPLHLVLISNGEPLKPESVRQSDKSVLFIINAIHPGESDGVDASMAFARDLAFDDALEPALSKVIVAIVPLYNIGGALNRNSGTRANQNGPREYGFRGNARNYDLNRDFVKCDTRNARSFAEIFHFVDPELFIDTHVSNGADYQHVMTTAHSQSDKLGLGLGKFLKETVEPTLFGQMNDAGFPTIPYVNSGGRPPEYGYEQFLETPRYSTGFTALFQTMGFMTETHMLKPYPQRVAATRQFLDLSLQFLVEQGATLQNLRQRDRDSYHKQETVPIAWKVDRNQPSRLDFLGYEATYIESKVTPGKRLFYDREQPFRRSIPFFNHYDASLQVKLPEAYLIPQQWTEVIELMKINQVEMETLAESRDFKAEVYQIDSVESRSAPYEGHYFHDVVNASVQSETYAASAGDILIPVHQDRARYVVETLEPQATDSFFRWNRFDTILQRKEYFSSYVFEETAAKLLAEDDELRAAFEKEKQSDTEFAKNRRAQLAFLYERSIHNEKSYRRYPVIRIIESPK